MVEGRLMCDEDGNGPAVYQIAQETERLLEERRKKEAAKRMAKLMKNFNYDLLSGDAGALAGACDGGPGPELVLEEPEAARLRRLEEVRLELEAGQLLTMSLEPTGPKYEEPLITRLRAVETVDELYRLADEIVVPAARLC